jgi:DNA adenine methylase
MSFYRSPLFYVGDKYKLLPQITKYFPQEVNKFVEPFVGGGSVFLNTKAKKYLLNDIDNWIFKLHNFLIQQRQNPDLFFEKIDVIIYKYGLSRSYQKNIIPEELKKEHNKTYFAKFNKDNFLQLRRDFNHNKEDLFLLYLLLIYGFNRMLRFNKDGNFNLPVGNVDFNLNVKKALIDYFEQTIDKEIVFSCKDYKVYLESIKFENDDFIYLDPPYLITFSEYNKLWNIQEEEKLLNYLDKLNKKKIKFALSNVIHYKGRTNEILLKWAKKYNIHPIQSNYISYHDNSIKTFSEVIITNYA